MEVEQLFKVFHLNPYKHYKLFKKKVFCLRWLHRMIFFILWIIMFLIFVVFPSHHIRCERRVGILKIFSTSLTSFAALLDAVCVHGCKKNGSQEANNHQRSYSSKVICNGWRSCCSQTEEKSLWLFSILCNVNVRKLYKKVSTAC